MSNILKALEFTRHEAEGKVLIQQHTRLIDGRSLLWTRDYITEQPVDFAGAQAAIEKINAEKYGGFDDWRLPTVEERFLLSDRSKSPAIDTEFFLDDGGWEWTGTVYASSPSVYAWGVFFDSGYSNWYYQDVECFVRAVRSSQ